MDTKLTLSFDISQAMQGWDTFQKKEDQVKQELQGMFISPNVFKPFVSSVVEASDALNQAGDSAKGAKKALDETGDTVTKTGDSWKKFGLMLAEVFAISKIAGFIEQSTKLATNLTDLRNGFQGTTKDIELFQKATAGTN